MIDKVVYGLVDDAYNLIFSIASVTLNNDVVEQIIKNLYILVGIFAFFRIALLLVNAIIDPEKLSEKGKGLPNILLRTIIMLVILVFLPILFNLAYDFQADVLGIEKIEKIDADGNKTFEIDYKESGNIIEKLILGESISGTKKSSLSPGDNFKTAALSALITVDEKFTTDDGLQVPSKANDWYGGYEPDNKYCTTSSCQQAINEWNIMYVNGKMDIDILSNYITVNEKVENEKVYVYNYSVVITTIAGGFIVYILLSFALDIGMRVFQLAALEIIAPVFVATFVDPQSASSGMFNRWLKEVGSTYANLFIRVACVSLLVLFASLLNQISFLEVGNNSSWVKLALMLGLLMFAKKAPKWISDLLGLKGEGLGGLGIGKKLKENVLGAEMFAKGAKGLIGAGAAGLRNLHYANRHRRNMLKEAREKNPELADYKSRRAYRKKLAQDKVKEKEDEAYGIWKNQRGASDGVARHMAQVEADLYKKDAKKAARKQLSDELKDAQVGARANAARVGSALINAAGVFKGAANAEKLSGSLKLAKDESEHFRQISGIQGKNVGEKVSKWISNRKEGINTYAFGDADAIANRADLLGKENFINDNYNKAALDNVKVLIPSFDKTKMVNGNGRGLQYTYTEEGVDIVNLDHFLRSIIANACGYKVHYETDANGKVKVDKDTGMPTIYYTGKDGNRVSDDIALKIRESAKHITSNEGTAKLQEIFNIKSGNLLEDYGRNLSNISDTTQIINNIRDSISKVTSTFANKIKELPDVIQSMVSGEAGKLRIDFNSLGLSSDLKLKLETIQGNGPLTSDNLSRILTEVEGNTALYSTFENLKTLALDNDEYNNYERLLFEKNKELNVYLDRQDNMNPGYSFVGYKMADEGRLLFEGEGIEEKLKEVRNISHAERERKQKSQDGRINDQVQLFERKKEEEQGK